MCVWLLRMHWQFLDAFITCVYVSMRPVVCVCFVYVCVVVCAVVYGCVCCACGCVQLYASMWPVACVSALVCVFKCVWLCVCVCVCVCERERERERERECANTSRLGTTLPCSVG